jgi:hypothetical protein
MRYWLTLGTATLAAAVLLGAPDTASALSACTASKLKVTGKKGAGKLGCHAKGVKGSVAVDPACLSGKETKFSSGWAKAEAIVGGNCVTTGDRDAIEAKVDAFVADVVTELTPSGNNGSTCTVAKLKAAGKKAAGKLGCYSKASKKGLCVDPACLSGKETKFSASWAKAEAIVGGACQTTGDQATIEAKVDAYVADVVSELDCCGCERITLTSGPGTLTVSVLPPFPFPTGVVTTMDVGAASNNLCDHSVTVASFTVPHFPIPALNYCSQVTNTGCAVATGGALGTGTLRDGNGPVGAPTNVTTVGDGRDGVCDTTVGACAGGGPANSLGDIDTTFSASASTGGRSALAIKQNSLTWSETDECTDPGGDPAKRGSTHDPDCGGTTPPVQASDGACCCVTASRSGSDGIISNFNFILRPTTDTGSAAYVDKNADSCSMEGLGPVGPVVGVGTPPPGPCCVVGQASTVVSVGIAMSGGAPLYDLIFSSSVPNTITACSPFVTATCTVSTNTCEF